MELNASDDRGISVVRNKIKGFASKIAMKNPNKYDFPYFFDFLKEIQMPKL